MELNHITSGSTDVACNVSLSKESLHQWLSAHPAISPRVLSKEAGLNNMYIHQLYNRDKTLTQKAIEKLLPVLEKYGWNK